MVNIESVPSEAGPDLGGIEQGIPNYEIEIAAACFAGLAMTFSNRFLDSFDITQDRCARNDRGQKTENRLRRRAGDG